MTPDKLFMTVLLSAIIYCSGWIVERAGYLDILDSDMGKGLFLQKDRAYQPRSLNICKYPQAVCHYRRWIKHLVAG